MKKYFMKGTQDEVQFGDMLELDFTKDTKNGTIHRHLETKFIPELVDILVEEGVIEVTQQRVSSLMWMKYPSRILAKMPELPNWKKELQNLKVWYQKSLIL